MSKELIVVGCLAIAGCAISLSVQLVVYSLGHPSRGSHYTGHFQSALSSEYFRVNTTGKDGEYESFHPQFVGSVINETADGRQDDRMGVFITPITIDGVKYFLIQTTTFDGYKEKLINVSMCPAIPK